MPTQSGEGQAADRVETRDKTIGGNSSTAAAARWKERERENKSQRASKDKRASERAIGRGR
jgi:hypothetical protein